MSVHFMVVTMLALPFILVSGVVVVMLWWLVARGIPRLRHAQATQPQQGRRMRALYWLPAGLYSISFCFPEALRLGRSFIAPQARHILISLFFAELLVELLVLLPFVAVWSILANRSRMAEISAPDESFTGVSDEPEDHWLVPEAP